MTNFFTPWVVEPPSIEESFWNARRLAEQQANSADARARLAEIEQRERDFRNAQNNPHVLIFSK